MEKFDNKIGLTPSGQALYGAKAKGASNDHTAFKEIIAQAESGALTLKEARALCNRYKEFMKEREKIAQITLRIQGYINFQPFMLATDWYFIIYTSDRIYCTKADNYHIALTEDSLDDGAELR